jgi:hypothetical protein
MTLLAYIAIAVVGIWVLYAADLVAIHTLVAVSCSAAAALVGWVVYGIATTDGPKL